jgi:hypothetical protein
VVRWGGIAWRLCRFRSALEFASPIVRDCASVAAPVLALLEAGIDIHCLRTTAPDLLGMVIPHTFLNFDRYCRSKSLRVMGKGDCSRRDLPVEDVVNSGGNLMLLVHKATGSLVEVLTLPALFNPSESTIVGCDQCGQEAQDPDNFLKSELVFPSGEPLPVCWLNPHYRQMPAPAHELVSV